MDGLLAESVDSYRATGLGRRARTGAVVVWQFCSMVSLDEGDGMAVLFHGIIGRGRWYQGGGGGDVMVVAHGHSPPSTKYCMAIHLQASSIAWPFTSEHRRQHGAITIAAGLSSRRVDTVQAVNVPRPAAASFSTCKHARREIGALCGVAVACKNRACLSVSPAAARANQGAPPGAGREG